MGKIVFRRVKGRIIPIFSQGNVERALKASSEQLRKRADIREWRETAREFEKFQGMDDVAFQLRQDASKLGKHLVGQFKKMIRDAQTPKKRNGFLSWFKRGKK